MKPHLLVLFLLSCLLSGCVSSRDIATRQYSHEEFDQLVEGKIVNLNLKTGHQVKVVDFEIGLDTTYYNVMKLWTLREKSILTKKIEYLTVAGPLKSRAKGMRKVFLGIGIGVGIGAGLVYSVASEDCEGQCIGQAVAVQLAMLTVPILGVAGAVIGSAASDYQKTKYNIIVDEYQQQIYFTERHRR